MTRLRATLTWEYDADPIHYGTDDPAEMARIDAGGDALQQASAAEQSDFTVEPVE
jgi:hypothetical protein